MKRINEMEQIRKQIKNQILNFTPEQLAQVVKVINRWADSYEVYESTALKALAQVCRNVKSTKDVIDLLARPEFVRSAKDVQEQTGENYFTYTFYI